MRGWGLPVGTQTWTEVEKKDVVPSWDDGSELGRPECRLAAHVPYQATFVQLRVVAQAKKKPVDGWTVATNANVAVAGFRPPSESPEEVVHPHGDSLGPREPHRGAGRQRWTQQRSRCPSVSEWLLSLQQGLVPHVWG